MDASSRRFGALTRGRSAAAEATTTRAVAPANAWSARARVEVTPTCGANPRYGSISCEGNGSTARSAAVAESPSRAERNRHTSPTACSRSPSPGTTYRTTPCGIECAAPATNRALADAVSPETTRAGTFMPLRAIAVFSSARRLSEVEVVTVARLRNFQCSPEAQPEEIVSMVPVSRQGW